ACVAGVAARSARRRDPRRAGGGRAVGGGDLQGSGQAGGPVGQWAGGPVGRWAGGPVKAGSAFGARSTVHRTGNGAAMVASGEMVSARQGSSQNGAGPAPRRGAGPAPPGC